MFPIEVRYWLCDSCSIIAFLQYIHHPASGMLTVVSEIAVFSVSCKTTSYAIKQVAAEKQEKPAAMRSIRMS
jgi:hypothetical protein